MLTRRKNGKKENYVRLRKKNLFDGTSHGNNLLLEDGAGFKC